LSNRVFKCVFLFPPTSCSSGPRFNDKEIWCPPLPLISNKLLGFRCLCFRYGPRFLSTLNLEYRRRKFPMLVEHTLFNSPIEYVQQSHTHSCGRHRLGSRFDITFFCFRSKDWEPGEIFGICFLPRAFQRGYCVQVWRGYFFPPFFSSPNGWRCPDRPMSPFYIFYFSTFSPFQSSHEESRTFIQFFFPF